MREGRVKRAPFPRKGGKEKKVRKKEVKRNGKK